MFDDDDDFAELQQYITPDPLAEFEVANFFRDNLLKTRSAVSEKSFHQFVSLSSNGARVDFILRLPAAHELPVEVDNYEIKDPIGFGVHKRNGNDAFKMGHYPVSVEDYNKAVLMAPKNDLGVLLANRAAAFYHLEKYDLSLRDCEQAIKIGYPKHLMYKLEERRARCLLGLKCHIKAVEAFKCALRVLDDAQLNSEKKSKLESDIRIMLAVMEKGQQLTQKERGVDKEKLLEMENQTLKDKDLVPRIKDFNPGYPSLSRAVEIRDAGGDVGRYAVATRDVKPGDILAVERPHCATLLGEHRLTHCYRCTIRLVAPLPASCYKCSSIAYCSPRCRDDDEELHRLECDILGPLWCSHASVTCFLALRAIIQHPYEEFLKIKQQKLELGKEQYTSKDYRTFHNLVTHEDERTSEDLFHRAYMAAWLLRVLKMSSYIPEDVKTSDKARAPLSKGELVIADAILHNLQVLQFNSHEISEFARALKVPDLSKGKSLFVGGGVYPSVALFNHSCNPGVVRYFVGTTMVLRAIKSIPAGAEIAENYGPIFTQDEENDRKRQLRLQYWFDCDCEACKDHWPTLDKIDPTLLRFKCETGPSCGNILPVNINTQMFMIPCSKCGKSTNILKGLKALQDTDSLYKTGTKYSEAGKHQEALKSYLTTLNILDETLALPMRDYHLCQQGVRLCMLALGNSSIISPKIR